jgi:hypothetical protein
MDNRRAHQQHRAKVRVEATKYVHHHEIIRWHVCIYISKSFQKYFTRVKRSLPLLVPLLLSSLKIDPNTKEQANHVRPKFGKTQFSSSERTSY